MYVHTVVKAILTSRGSSGACSQNDAVVLCVRQLESSSWKMPPAAAGVDDGAAAAVPAARDSAASAVPRGAVDGGASARVAPEGMSESPTAVRAALTCAADTARRNICPKGNVRTERIHVTRINVPGNSHVALAA